MSLDYTIVNNGDASICIIFDAEISVQLSKYIVGICSKLRAFEHGFIKEIIPSYKNITLIYNPTKISLKSLKKYLVEILNEPLQNNEIKHNNLVIPVCYEEDFSPDLPFLARHCNLSINKVIHKHCKNKYLVHMLGFLPGFLYLGNLDESLHCPRKETPDLIIPEGAVAIGGSQTGIYPIQSPGGWQVIGRTPLQLFSPQQEQPFIAKPLDTIQFKSINKQEFESIKNIQS